MAAPRIPSPEEVAGDLRGLGIPCESAPAVEPLPGDAGARLYARIRVAPARTLLLMLVPSEGDSERGGALAGGELPYLSVQRFLKARGLPVPEVHGWDPLSRRLYHEDFGSRHVSADPGAYGKAVELLAEMQRRTAQPDPHCLAFRRAFDETAIRAELSEFSEFGFPHAAKRPAPASLGAGLDSLARAVADLPRRFSHRDFHGDNLLVLPDGSLGMIDFQDAFLAPGAYDLASLLTDREAPDRLGFDRIDALVRQSGIPEEEFWLVALQRQMKVAGRFVSLEKRGKKGYLHHLPTTWRVIARALPRTGRGALKELLASAGAPV